MTLREILNPTSGIPERIILWVSDDGLTMITWNQSKTFSVWLNKSGFRPWEDDEKTWTVPNVISFVQAKEEVYNRVSLGLV